MKIKKVEDKPMLIHTKQKAKIHSHEMKNADIKGSNIYTVNRSPKVNEAAISGEVGKKKNGSKEYRKGKSTYRKSTVNGGDNAGAHVISKFRKNLKESNQSIKVKQTNLHITGRTGVVGAKAATDQMEGGQEMQQAAYMVHEAFRPMIGTASRGAKVFKKQLIEQKRKIKKVEAGKRLAKKSANKATKDAVKGTAKKAKKETAKKVSKLAAKTATTATTSAAGSVGGPAGIAIGMAAGYASGVAIERKDTQMANRNRKLAFFLDKMKAQENQQDSIVKLMKDLIIRRALLWIKTVAPVIGLVLLLLVLVVAMITIPVIAVVAVIYNSPFALFLPPLEAGDTVQTVASAYVAEIDYPTYGVACCVPLSMVIKDFRNLDEEEIKYVMNPGTHLDFLIFHNFSKQPVLAVETDGYYYHQEDSVQGRRDR